MNLLPFQQLSRFLPVLRLQNGITFFLQKKTEQLPNVRVIVRDEDVDSHSFTLLL